MIVAVCAAACTLAAALLGRSAWAAACGAGVVVVMAAIEKLAARAGRGGSFGRGMAVGLGGMLARMALAVGVLLVIGLVAAKASFVDATLAFAATYTVYNFARLWRHPAVPGDAGAGSGTAPRSGGTTQGSGA